MKVAPTTTPGRPGWPHKTRGAAAGRDYGLLRAGAWKSAGGLEPTHDELPAEPCRGLTGSQNFWSPAQRVTVFDVFAKQGDSVDATIYFFNDGKIIEQQASYGLVTADGL
jgi:hypothetical protein